MKLDIKRARGQRPYSKWEYVGRVVWAIASQAFRLSPRPMFKWRAFLLRCFGATVGRRVHVYPSAKIVIPWNLQIGDDSSIGEDVLVYNLGPVKIGARSTISHRAHLCAGTHDYRDPSLPLVRSSISIGDDAWVCAQSFVGPGVVVGEGAIISAAAVVFKEVCPWVIVAGNPAQFVKRRILKTESAQ